MRCSCPDDMFDNVTVIIKKQRSEEWLSIWHPPSYEYALQTSGRHTAGSEARKDE